MLGIDEAIDRALAVYRRLPAERVVTRHAAGRHLVGELLARHDLPPFDASAMDGYAVRTDDVRTASETNPVRLRLGGEVRAGQGLMPEMAKGAAIRIFTGAEVPEGADAVVAQEDTSRDGDDVLVRFAPKAAMHIRKRASDVRAGEALLGDGSPLRAGEVAMLVSQHVTAVDVVRRPVVAIVSTGDELREPGETMTRGSIVNSNAWMLAALVEREGAVARVLPTAPDDPTRIRAALTEALQADVVLTSGGVSVGDHDHVPRVLEELGFRGVVDKVRMKPGKPVRVGTVGGVVVTGLPGNPASALVGFELFVAPGLRAMQGSGTPFPRGLVLPILHSVARSGGRPELARGRIVDVEGKASCELTSTQGSGALRSLAQVNALVAFGPSDTEVAAGAEVFALPLDVGGQTARNPFLGRREVEGRPG